MAFIDRIKPAPVGGGFAMDEYWVWCGSVIEGEDGRYHMFAARWPKELPFFEGYEVHSEIVRAESETPEGPYEFREVVLPERGEDYWDGRMTHNPTVRVYKRHYLLYYIGATYVGDAPTIQELRDKSSPKTGESYNNIRIGLAVSKSVTGPWQRMDEPILMPRAGKWDSKVVTNPAPCVLKDGRVFLYYRSNTPDGLRIGLAGADHFGGPYERLEDDPVIEFGDGGHVEDPFVWQTGKGFEMLAKDMSGSITGEKHAGVHALSKDGVAWELAPTPKAYSRTVRWDDGTETTQGSLERPQLLIKRERPTHLFAATGDGPGGFRNATRTWNMVMPLG